MPDRVQARGALVLRKELKCNILRMSHYPQAPAFLDACDEAGLLVLEEIPGWQHIGDKAWQDPARTNALAHSLDDSHQTGGIRNRYDSEPIEDVFTMNDFGFPLWLPNHPVYLNTESNGHMFSTKRFHNAERLAVFYAWGDHDGGYGPGIVPICSNCDLLKITTPESCCWTPTPTARLICI